MKKLNFVTVLPWVLVAVLLIANFGYFGYKWQMGDGKTVTATGQVEVKNAPDMYSFDTYYESKSTDRAATVAEMNTKSKEVTDGLKAAGADPAKIKTSLSSNQNYSYPETNAPEKTLTTLNVHIEADTLEAAQKLQDYFVASGAKGTLSPMTSFKPETRKKIEFDLREQAAADAKKNAEQSAKLLGKKLGKVESISDVSFGGYPMPYMMDKVMVNTSEISAGRSAEPSAPINPGLETSTVSISITYRLK